MQARAIEVFAPPWRSLVDCRGSRCWRPDGRQLRTENTFYGGMEEMSA
jgi:hypothetical protein